MIDLHGSGDFAMPRTLRMRMRDLITVTFSKQWLISTPYLLIGISRSLVMHVHLFVTTDGTRGLRRDETVSSHDSSIPFPRFDRDAAAAR